MDENAFDITIVGTGLTESIIAAALSKTGLRVLHIDTEANYGGTDASLTLIDLHHLLLSPPGELTDISVPVPIPEALLRDSRNYAISLAPSIVPSIGPLIDTLVNSGVSRYVKFKLLDGVGLYTNASNNGDEQAGSSAHEKAGSVKTVPGSKEDVFKSKELGLLQKRKLMKFLMATATQSDKPATNGSNSTDNVSFLNYLTSKEVGLDAEVASAVAYALSLSSDPNESTSSAIKRLRKYIRSTGRHGNSPFLIGHFGGAGEIAQGFCRASAVAGATYILGRPFSITRTTGDASGPNFQLTFEGIDDTLTSRLLVSRKSPIPNTMIEDELTETQGESVPSRRLARCIAILDGPVYFSQPPANEDESTEEPEEENNDRDGKGIVDSAILIFPPGSLIPSNSSISVSDSGVVTAFISGPDALTCPDGKRIVYLSTEIQHNASPEASLQPYLSAVQCLNRPSIEPSPVLMSLFYAQPIHPSSHSPGSSTSISIIAERSGVHQSSTGIVLLHPPRHHLAEFGDEASEEAERVFWVVMEAIGLDGRSEARVGHKHWGDVVEEGLKRGDSAADGEHSQAIEVADSGEGGGEDVEKVTVMWPQAVIDESTDAGW